MSHDESWLVGVGDGEGSQEKMTDDWGSARLRFECEGGLMSIETVVMPDLGDIAQAVVIEWLHPVGAILAEGEDLLEVETEKATFVIPAPVSGRLISVLEPETSTVKTGQALGEMELA